MSFAFEEDGHLPFVDLWERTGEEWAWLRDVADAGAGTDASSAPTLVVAHGALNRALLLHMLGLPMASWRDDQVRCVALAKAHMFPACRVPNFLLLATLPMQTCRKEHFLFGNCGCVELEWIPGSEHACRWRRRYPEETEWVTREEEVARAQAVASYQ